MDNSRSRVVSRQRIGEARSTSRAQATSPRHNANVFHAGAIGRKRKNGDDSNSAPTLPNPIETTIPTGPIATTIPVINAGKCHIDVSV